METVSGTSIPVGLSTAYTQPNVQLKYVPATYATGQRRVSPSNIIGPNSQVNTEQMSYWQTPEMCNPRTQAFRCPITIFIVLWVLGAIVNIWALFRVPDKNLSGRDIKASELWISFFIGVTFHLSVGLLFGWWIYEQCRKCVGGSGITFILAIVVPVASAFIVGLIMGAVLNVAFLWTASRPPNPNNRNQKRGQTPAARTC